MVDSISTIERKKLDFLLKKLKFAWQHKNPIPTKSQWQMLSDFKQKMWTKAAMDSGIWKKDNLKYLLKKIKYDTMHPFYASLTYMYKALKYGVKKTVGDLLKNAAKARSKSITKMMNELIAFTLPGIKDPRRKTLDIGEQLEKPKPKAQLPSPEPIKIKWGSRKALIKSLREAGQIKGTEISKFFWDKMNKQQKAWMLSANLRCSDKYWV